MRRSARGARGGAIALGVIGMIIGLRASPAAADPPNPTNYRSTVTTVSPAVDGVEIDVVGGDSFLRVRTHGNRDVVVLGYDAEPYLHFTADGTVLENARSPAVALNRSRYGTTYDERADAKAAPEWHPVAHDGAYVWHDHRIHWMARSTPTQLAGGQGKVIDWTIPLLVDGKSVQVKGELYRTAPPSVVPYLIAGLVAAAVAALAMRRVRAIAAALLLAVSLAAVVVSIVEQLSIPAAAGRRLSFIVIPAMAAACAIVALGWRRSIYGFALKAAAGLILPLWIFLNLKVLTHSHLPGDAAPVMMRGAVTAAAAAVIAFVVIDVPRELRAVALQNEALDRIDNDDR
jgi:hypothetical protein